MLSCRWHPCRHPKVVYRTVKVVSIVWIAVWSEVWRRGERTNKNTGIAYELLGSFINKLLFWSRLYVYSLLACSFPLCGAWSWFCVCFIKGVQSKAHPKRGVEHQVQSIKTATVLAPAQLGTPLQSCSTFLLIAAAHTCVFGATKCMDTKAKYGRGMTIILSGIQYWRCYNIYHRRDQPV